MQQINLAEVYRNEQAGFDVRVVEHRGERGEALEPLYLVQVRRDADSPWVATAASDGTLFFAGARATILRQQRTRPPELGG